MTTHVWRCVLWIAALAAVCGGCVGPDVVWTGIYNFEDGRWEKGDRIYFEPDTASLQYNRISKAIVGLRYGADASLQTIPVVVEGGKPDEAEQTDTLRLELLPELKRTGNNGRSGIFETGDTITMHAVPTPGWRITFSLPEGTSTVDGLFSLTLTLTK